MATDFPNKGDDKAISLSNSEYPRFDRAYAERLKERSPEIWKAGGNIRGNEAFTLWGRANDGERTKGVLDWIKEREAWAARHMGDGSQFPEDQANLSNIAGVVAAIKWGVILEIGEKTMKDKIEEVEEKLDRQLSLDVERRDAQPMETEGRTVSGYAAVFNSETTIGNFREVIRPGAFDSVLERSDVYALYNHDDNVLLARRRPDGSGTLALSVDERGLKYEFEAPNTQAGNDLVELLKRGDLDGSSFAFTIRKDKWEDEDDMRLREVLEVEQIFDISVVNRPAYNDSTAMVRCEDSITFVETKSADNMRESKTYRKEAQEAREKFEAVVGVADKEARDLTSTEKEAAEALDSEFNRLMDRADVAQKREEQIARTAFVGSAPAPDREIAEVKKRFSFSSAVTQLIDGRELRGVEREVYEEAKREAQASGYQMTGNFAIPNVLTRADAAGVFGVTGYDADGSGAGSATATGAGFVGKQVTNPLGMGFETPLVEKIGIATITGATSTIQVPKVATRFAASIDAVDASNERAALTADGTLGQVDFTAKRAGHKMTHSRAFLAQAGAGTDQFLLNEVGREIARAIDISTLGAIVGETYLDSGNGHVTQSSDGAEVAAAAMMAKVAAQEFENGVFVVAPTAMQDIRTSAIGSASLLLGEGGNTMYGKQVVESARLNVSDAMLYGDFAAGALLVYYGPGTEFTIDPYSQGANALVNIYATRFYCGKATRPEAFSYCNDL